MEVKFKKWNTSKVEEFKIDKAYPFPTQTQMEDVAYNKCQEFIEFVLKANKLWIKN